MVAPGNSRSWFRLAPCSSLPLRGALRSPAPMPKQAPSNAPVLQAGVVMSLGFQKQIPRLILRKTSDNPWSWATCGELHYQYLLHVSFPASTKFSWDPGGQWEVSAFPIVIQGSFETKPAFPQAPEGFNTEILQQKFVPNNSALRSHAKAWVTSSCFPNCVSDKRNPNSSRPSMSGYTNGVIFTCFFGLFSMF